MCNGRRRRCTETMPAADRHPVPVLLLARELAHGGSERQLAETARAMDRRHFIPHVGCVSGRGDRADELRAAGIPVVEFPMTSLASRAAWDAAASLRHYVKKNAIRVIHAFDPAMAAFATPIGRLLWRPRVVLTSQRCFEDTIYPPQRWQVRMAHRLANGTVANCEATRRHLIEHYHLPERKIRVCRNGLDAARFPAGPRSLPPALAGASLVIGTVCVLRPEKGLPLLIEAFNAVRGDAPGAKLLVVGSGPEREALVGLSKSLGIAEDCHFVPATANVAEWMRSIDIFVMPSLSEALSNSIMEAMASGCCVVASDVGGNPELVEHGRSGLLFSRGSAQDLAARLRSLIRHRNLIEVYAAKGCERIRTEFSLAAAAGRMQSIYEEFLTRRGRQEVPLVEMREQEPGTKLRKSESAP
jgi:glycosyltransferase involved in cell wall biosynthesis